MSAEAIGWIVAAVILIGVVVFLFKGMIQTFRRNWVLALILLIFAGPVWFVWAIIEMFLPFNPKDAARPFETNVNVSQNMNVPNAVPEPIDEGDRFACPQCAEMIKLDAMTCRFCGIRV